MPSHSERVRRNYDDAHWKRLQDLRRDAERDVADDQNDQPDSVVSTEAPDLPADHSRQEMR